MTNISTIAADAPFLDLLAAELWKRTNGDGFLLSKYLILLPTRRSCRALGESFTRLAQGKPVLLPRMRPLGEVDEDEITFADEEDFDPGSSPGQAFLPAIAPLKRLMLLTQQVQKRDPSLSWDQAAQAAEALARFLDQIQIHDCDITTLPQLVEEQELAAHWQEVLQFLDIVTQNWPLILRSEGALDPAQRRNRVLRKQAELWQQNPPAFPIIAAGSTGSIPAVADLLQAIAGLPNGEVILPGLDQILDNDAWADIGETHPQYNMKLLLEKIGLRREDVKNFAPDFKSSARLRLLSESMRPASSTDEWRGLAGQIGDEAIAGLTQITTSHPQEEAQVIALRLRALLEEKNKSACFVTADRGLAMRVAMLMRRWNIEVDDSGGQPLSMLPLGSFLTLTLAAANPQASAVDLLALLKHPLTALGGDGAQCREEARGAELLLRNNKPENFERLREILKVLTQNRHQLLSLADHIAAHVAVAETLAQNDNESGADRLWRGDAGDAAAEWLSDWRKGAENFPPLTGADYAALFVSLSGSKTVRLTTSPHPCLSILGPLEARLIHADLIILGGMNEGGWPPDAGYDPWMSRPMRKKFNLPAPEFRIGLSAHDFAQLAASRNVMITRAMRSDGIPTVPSRFLLQIDTVLRAAGLPSDALTPAEPWRNWAHALDMPAAAPKACDPPAPRPPVSTRPTTLSVSDIGVWLRNPYAIYARHILGLKKLEELDAEADASDRGTLIHRALERFLNTYPHTLPDDAEAKLIEIGQAVFAKEANNPRVQSFWWARFLDIAAWFIENERTRREAGTMPAKAEAKGSSLIDGFTLTGRADRIDRTPDGNVAIVDYKTGGVPSNKEVTSGIEPQLQLLALIAASGGFEGLSKAETQALEYWILKGGREGCEMTSFTDDLADLIAKAEAGLKNLITTFADAQTPYEATPKPRLSPRFNDYAHLSRLAEWGRSGEQ